MRPGPSTNVTWWTTYCQWSPRNRIRFGEKNTGRRSTYLIGEIFGNINTMIPTSSVAVGIYWLCSCSTFEALRLHICLCTWAVHILPPILSYHQTCSYLPWHSVVSSNSFKSWLLPVLLFGLVLVLHSNLSMFKTTSISGSAMDFFPLDPHHYCNVQQRLSPGFGMQLNCVLPDILCRKRNDRLLWLKGMILESNSHMRLLIWLTLGELMKSVLQGLLRWMAFILWS